MNETNGTLKQEDLIRATTRFTDEGTTHMSDIRQMSVASQRLVDFIP
jgi:hypothetical protein